MGHAYTQEIYNQTEHVCPNSSTAETPGSQAPLEITYKALRF